MESDEQGTDFVRGWHAAYSLHHDLGTGVCEECSDYVDYGIVPWPCRTIKALEGRL